MAEFTFDRLKKEYENFNYPRAMFIINGKEFSKNKKKLAIADIEIELTSGYEASIATFSICNGFDDNISEFKFQDLKPYIMLGSSVEIYLGYGVKAREVFRGFISRVNFTSRKGEMGLVQITAMDVKGIMMAGSYAKQLKATVFSEAVKEILQKTAYTKLQSNQIITKLNIGDTPDKQTASQNQGKASAHTIEMVSESDYEFVVKAAKKFNYEFFSVGGTVYFRKAKCNTEILMELDPGKGMLNMDIGYDFTGLVEKVEVRGMDVGKAKLLKKAQKIKNKISMGNKAKSMLSQSQKVYIDPTIASKVEAGYRAEYLAEDIKFRFGSVEADIMGLPELIPGRFIKITGLGDAVSNTFYLSTVRHVLDDERGYYTHISGKAEKLTK